jgi:hypothetical protein
MGAVGRAEQKAPGAIERDIGIALRERSGADEVKRARGLVELYAWNGLDRTAAIRKRLSALTVIGITSFSALKRWPGCSEPFACSVYMPISPSSALET